MTEEVKTEMSPAEELKSIIEETVASKADAAALEGLVKSEDLEGFVKADAIEAAKSEAIEAAKAAQAEAVEAAKADILEQVESKLVQAPAIITESKGIQMGYFEKSDLEQLRAEGQVLKTIDGTNATTGDPVQSFGPYADLRAANPFRQVARVIPVASSSFKLPNLTATTVTKNGDAAFSTANTATLNAGSTVTVDHYRSLQQVSEVEEADLPGIVAEYQRDSVAAIALSEEDSIITLLNAATITEQNTGVAAGLPSSVDAWFDLFGQLPSQYWGNASFVMHPDAWMSVRQLGQNGTGSDLVVDIDQTGFRLMGRPVYLSTEMDDGNAASENPVYFGDFGRALVIGDRMGISMRTTRDNSLGHISSLTEMRSGVGTRETAALVRFNCAS